jgi:hypothetical protein
MMSLLDPIYVAILVVLITEAAKVREHLWAGVTHEHWAKKPVVKRIPASDAFHVASALSHYPIVIALLWASEALLWHYMVVAILSQLLWWQAKRSNGRNWPNKFEQLFSP